MSDYETVGPGFWAAIDHCRTWKAFDGPVLDRVMRDGGLTDYTAAAIAIEYNLMNSLPWRGGFARFDRIAAIVNEAAAPVADDAPMAGKRDAVVSLAQRLQREFSLPTCPYSASSKLFWFVRPSGWTMFDKHAFNGLFDRSRGRGKDVPAFYDYLIEADFPGLSARVTAQGASRGVKLRGDQVLDKFLMFRGMEKKSGATFRDRIKADCQKFLEAEGGAALEAVAKDMDALLHADALEPATFGVRRP